MGKYPSKKRICLDLAQDRNENNQVVAVPIPILSKLIIYQQSFFASSDVTNIRSCFVVRILENESELRYHKDENNDFIEKGGLCYDDCRGYKEHD